MKRWIILFITAGAVAVLLFVKFSTREKSAAVSSPSSDNKRVLYLFHNPKDQDDECKRIYAFADRAEQEFGQKLIVKRPNVAQEKTLMQRYSIRVLPTILIVSPAEVEEYRFEGEGDAVASALEQMMNRFRNE